MILRLIKLWRLKRDVNRLTRLVHRLLLVQRDMRLYGAHPETLKRCAKHIEVVKSELRRATAEYSLLKNNKDEKCEIERRLKYYEVNGGTSGDHIHKFMDEQMAKDKPKHECACGGHVGEKLAKMTSIAAEWERRYTELDRWRSDLIRQNTNLKTDLQSARDANTAQTNNETVLVNYRRQVAELVKQRDGFKADIVKLRGQRGASQVRIVELITEVEALRKMMRHKSEEAQVSYGHFETPEDCKARLAELEKAAAEKYDRTHKAYDAGVETLAQLHHASMLYSYAAKQHRMLTRLLKQRDEAWNDLNYEKHTETLGRITEFVHVAAPKKRESESKALNGPRFILTDKCREEIETIAPAPQHPFEIRDPLKYAEEVTGVMQLKSETVDEYFNRIGFPNGIRMPYTTRAAKRREDLD